MSVLVDQLERDRFVAEQGKNISVIAPAGVGKTRSIVERIVRLAQNETVAIDRLPRLIVVTYSVRAAQEMQQRARAAIRAAGVSSRVHRAFQQTFFGTIHSYCVRLLERFGHYLGLPSSVALLQADDDLWNRFLLRGLGQGTVGHASTQELFHFYAPEKLYALGQEIAPGPALKLGAMPVLSLQKLLDYRDNALHAATKKSIVRAQEAAQEWSESWARGDRFRPLPPCPASEKAAAFAEIWRETFAPLHHWLRDGALAFGRDVANAYEAFRLSEAVMTYDDQVRLALRVLELPAVRRELAMERLSVLLDEAQDTDPRQFEVLLRVAGLRDDSVQAEDQSFCIVGDFQQAIYAPRSDLAIYQRVHEEISAEPRGTSSQLKVTFRCDRAIIDFVNRIFHTLLNGTREQCAFVELVPREEAGPGQVVRWICPDEPEHEAGKKIKAEVRARHEARFVAQQIQKLGPSGLGANSWSQVAILCPRKKWLLQIARELAVLKLPVQIHSSDERRQDRTPCAWLTALIWIAAHPEDSFEIAGVLREIFGVSDHDMAEYTAGDGDKLRLDRNTPQNNGRVAVALNLLRETFAPADEMPLHELAQRIVGKTRLRERLNSLPDLELEDVDLELDDILALTTRRSAEGATLSDLAEELQRGLSEASPAEEKIHDAIQLLTSHKAKGLEWQTVIVPYVFRTIEFQSPSYPRVVQGAEGKEIVCRDKADYEIEAKDFVNERERQQLQRLLYVMGTRARHTLLLIDDETLFAEQSRRGGWSSGELLGFGHERNRSIWQGLPKKLSLADPPSLRESVLEPVLTARADLSSDTMTQAITRANSIPRRITPHALAVHSSNEAEPERQLEREDDLPAIAPGNRGTLYGTWWHEFVQTIPWQGPVATWQQRFLEAQESSHQPERSRREWDLFCRSQLADWLAEPGRLIQVELPFLWLDADRTCLEGVMDLAVCTEGESSWRVIDWKTNRLGPAGKAGLVGIYRGQVEAYVRVLREMLSVEVRGSLYLTETGDWVEIE